MESAFAAAPTQQSRYNYAVSALKTIRKINEKEITSPMVEHKGVQRIGRARRICYSPDGINKGWDLQTSTGLEGGFGMAKQGRCPDAVGGLDSRNAEVCKIV